MKSLSNLYFTDVDVCKPEFTHSLHLNFNLYLLILLRSAYVSKSILVSCKYIWVELSALSSSVFKEVSLSTEKQSRIKFYQPNFKQYLWLISYLLPEMLANILGVAANWGRYSELVTVRLSNIISGSITIKSGCTIKDKTELKVRKFFKKWLFSLCPL